MNTYHVHACIRAEVTVLAESLRDVISQINHIPVRQWNDPEGLFAPIEPEWVDLDCPGCNRTINVYEEDHCERCGTCKTDCEGGHA